MRLLPAHRTIPVAIVTLLMLCGCSKEDTASSGAPATPDTTHRYERQGVIPETYRDLRMGYARGESRELPDLRPIIKELDRLTGFNSSEADKRQERDSLPEVLHGPSPNVMDRSDAGALESDGRSTSPAVLREWHTQMGLLNEVYAKSPRLAGFDSLIVLHERLVQLHRDAADIIPEASEPASLPSLVPAGAVLYEQRCLSCHGEGGRGVEGLFPALPTGPMNADSSVTLILSGGPGKKHPVYRARLSDAEVAAVLNHVQSFGGVRASEIRPEHVRAVRERLSHR